MAVCSIKSLLHAQTHIMKKFLFAGLVVGLIVSSFSEALASGKTKNQSRESPISKKGYWVIQQAEKNASQVNISYYDNANNLIRKETRSKKKADISRKKVIRSLKRSLEEAVECAEPII